ncbi:Protein of unknown function DUF1168 [Macleaya cordata]|uniref:Uncharacterized protein n=1 Tax=Macleaya cordata TaxID=56857 RepID=A0A200QZL3_MACCD|nr:Protein of unknown function DUF1168 [Macleaya cordata]
MSSVKSNGVKEGNLQVVAAPEGSKPALPPLPRATLTTSNTLVEYKSSGPKEEEKEDLEVKLRRIIDLVPVRVSNTSGSSAGSGSGDFHQLVLSEIWEVEN